MEPKTDMARVKTATNQRSVPDGDVMIRRVRGPQQGQNVYLGLVKSGRIYTTDVETAVILTGKDGEFEVLPEFVDEVEAARKAAK